MYPLPLLCSEPNSVDYFGIRISELGWFSSLETAASNCRHVSPSPPVQPPQEASVFFIDTYTCAYTSARVHTRSSTHIYTYLGICVCGLMSLDGHCEFWWTVDKGSCHTYAFEDACVSARVRRSRTAFCERGMNDKSEDRKYAEFP